MCVIFEILGESNKLLLLFTERCSFENLATNCGECICKYFDQLSLLKPIHREIAYVC